MAVFDNTGLKETHHADTRCYFDIPYDDFLLLFTDAWGDKLFEFGGNVFIIQWYTTRWVICDPSVVDEKGMYPVRYEGCKDTIEFFDTPIDFLGNKSIHELFHEIKWFDN